MKNGNNVLIVTLAALAFAFAPVVQAGPRPDGGPVSLRANAAPSPDGGPTSMPPGSVTALPRPTTTPANTVANEAMNAENAESEQKMPVITIHSTDNVTRGKTGAFVLDMKPALMLGGMYVNFSVGGTAIEGVDYIALVSPAYVGQSGYAVIHIQTLPDPRESFSRQPYSVVISLKDGAGYFVGAPSSATMWIKP